MMPSVPEPELPSPETWFVVKRPDGVCEILPNLPEDLAPDASANWGPYDSRSDAIARRIGLIRAGKCRPL
ncbi:MAG: DDE transposase family protein [Cyanobacteria bacterium]|nr:DDE transposase family protein [Cyanobacteriota bacterium]MDA0866208.1 DDE transposase family protein [Cyanobacteriota bacterium]